MTSRSVGLIIPSLSHGGAERVVSVLADEWSRTPGVDVTVLTFSDLPDFFALPATARRIRLSLGSRPGPLALLRLAWRARRALREAEVTHALSFMDKYNVFFLLGLAGSGVRLSVSDRSNPLKPLPSWLRLLKRLTYPRAACVIAQTRQAADELARRTGAKRIVALPNPLPPAEGSSGNPHARLILNVGRLVPEKGQAHLLRAFAMSAPRDWRLAILGEGPLRPRLEALALEAGIADRVTMPGVADVAEWSARASIFAFSSISEGFPNALVEAMAKGMACVSFDCDAGPREILTSGKDGWLVPVGDEIALADALKSLIGDEALRRRLGEAGRRRMADFDAALVAADYLRACEGE